MTDNNLTVLPFDVGDSTHLYRYVYTPGHGLPLQHIITADATYAAREFVRQAPAVPVATVVVDLTDPSEPHVVVTGFGDSPESDA